MDLDKSINTPAPEGINNQSYFENPWAVEDGLEHFLNYNCPECEMKSASRELFLQHAINQHPLVKECLHLLTGVKDESYFEDDDAERAANAGDFWTCLQAINGLVAALHPAANCPCHEAPTLPIS